MATTPQPDPGAMFRGLPPERQKALLAKMNPQQKQKLYAALQTKSVAGQKPPATAGAGADKPGYLSEAVAGPVRAIKGAATGAYELMLPRGAEGTPERKEETAYGPTGRFLLHLGQDTYAGLTKGKAARDKAEASGEGWAGKVLATLEQYPIIGGAIRHGEKGGPGYLPTPESVGAATELATYAALPKASEEIAKAVKPVVAKALSNYAEKSYDKAIGTKPEEAGTDPGGHMARLVGPVWSYKQALTKAQALIDRITPAIDKSAADAKASGTVIQGLDKVVDAIYDPAIRKARNAADTKLVQALQAEKVRASSTVEVDPVTGNNAYVDLKYAKGIDPVTALAKKRAIQTRGWEGGVNETVRSLNRQLGHSFAEALDKQVPKMGALSKQDAALLDAREAIQRSMDQAKVGLQDRLKGMLQAGAPGLLAYGALRLGGAGFGSYFGAAGLMYVWNKLPNASLRAAAAARIADLLTDTKINVPPRRSGAAKAGPASPPPGASPATSGGPSSSVPGPAAGAATPPGAAGAGPIPAVPPAGASVSSTTFDPNAMAVKAATDKALGRGPVQVQKVPEGLSGVPEGLRKYADYLSELLTRRETPKSGADKVAIDKQIESLKKVLDPTVDPVERTKLIDKIDTTMRKQKSRSVAAAKAPVVGEPTAVGVTAVKETGGKSFEPVDPNPGPEEQALLLDKLKDLYTEIKKQPGGKESLPALMKLAKDAKMTTAQIYNESLEVYNFLKKEGGNLPKAEK